MLSERDQSAFDWIRKGHAELHSSKTLDWNGNFVTHLIPPVFESYAKLLHRIEAYHDFIDKPLSARENEILRIPSCEPLRSFVESRRADSQRRVRWKELAVLLDVPFAPAINHHWYRKRLPDPWCWPRLLTGPNDGHLNEEECERLASVLKDFTGSQDCFFRFSDIPFYAGPGQSTVFRGKLDEVSVFQKDKCLSFEYWWPSGRNWVVCSDYDLPFTIIGGPSQLVSALMRDTVLECVEVELRTRIDVFAPIP